MSVTPPPINAYIKRHLPSSPFYESRRRQPSIPTAQASLQGLQADPRRLANAHAAHKSPCKTSASEAVRRLALMGERNQTIVILFPFRSAALHQNDNPLPIHNSLPLELKERRSGDLSLLPPRISEIPRFFLRTKSLHLLSKFSPPEVIRLQLVNAPLIPTGEE